jgi:zinc protease
MHIPLTTIQHKTTRIALIKRAVPDLVMTSLSLPVGSYGLNNEYIPVLASMILTFGTEKYSKEALHTLLEEKNISISIRTTFYATHTSVGCFKEDCKEAYALAVSMLMDNQCKKDDFDSAKHIVLEDIKTKMTDTAAVAKNALYHTLFKEDHPLYQRTFDELRELCEKVTLAQVKKFLSSLCCTVSVATVAGDIEEDNALVQLKKTLSHFTAKPAPDAPLFLLEAAHSHTDKKVAVADKLSNAVILAHVLELSPTDKEYLAFLLLVDMLGGGFSSHLMQTIRDRDGLCYGVYCAATSSHKVRGVFVISGDFTLASYPNALPAIKKELNIFLDKKCTQNDLDISKEGYLTNTLLSHQSTQSVRSQVHSALENNEPVQFIEDLETRLKAITLLDIENAKRYIKPECLTEFSAGTFEAS